MISPPRAARGRFHARAIIALAAATSSAMLGLAGCHTARMALPPPPLRAASAASYALDVEFAEPLAMASAEDPAHYVLIPAAGGPAAAVTTATLIDTLNGRVVQLLVPDWLGADPDGATWTVTTTGVMTLEGRSTGTRSATFQAGLGYTGALKPLFDARCNSCHGPARADGSYRTDTLAGLSGNGVDSMPNLVPGDPTCLLVKKCKPQNSMYNLGGLTYFDFEMIRNWVTSYDARP